MKSFLRRLSVTSVLLAVILFTACDTTGPHLEAPLTSEEEVTAEDADKSGTLAPPRVFLSSREAEFLESYIITVSLYCPDDTGVVSLYKGYDGITFGLETFMNCDETYEVVQGVSGSSITVYFKAKGTTGNVQSPFSDVRSITLSGSGGGFF